MRKIAIFSTIFFLLLITTFIVFGQIVLSAAPANSLIKGSGDAVYFLAEDGKRYVFPNENIYFSWYSDFSEVITISNSELASYPLGKNLNYRPGIRLIKLTTDPTVYAIGPNGQLHAIPDEQTALDLYGTSWADLVDDLPDAFFTDYSLSTSLTGSAHPVGTIFKYQGSNEYFILYDLNGMRVARKVPSSLFSILRINTSRAITIAITFDYIRGNDLTSADQQIKNPDQPSSLTLVDQDLLPPPSPATINVTTLPSLPRAISAVKNDTNTQLYGITLTGDKTHSVTIDQITFFFHIDAGGGDSDFVLGTDEDLSARWSVGEIIKDLKLVDISNNSVYATTTRVSSSDGVAVLKPNIILDPNEVLNLNLLATMVVTPVKQIRFSAGLNPATDILASSSTASSVSITPDSDLNKTTTPSVIITPTSYGHLSITSSNPIGDSIQTLGSTIIPYHLKFTSSGEPFIVKGFTLELTTLGSQIHAIDRVQINYTDQNNSEKTDEMSGIENRKIRFENVAIFVDKNSSTEIPIQIITKSNSAAFSNSRIQLRFIQENFTTFAAISSETFSSIHFPDSTKLTDTASISPVTILRSGNASFRIHQDSPTENIYPFTETSVLVFNIAAIDNAIKIYKITFKIETNDVNTAGADNDILERWSNMTPTQISKLYRYNTDPDKKTRMIPQSVTYGIFDNSLNDIDTTPTGLETGVGDYGVLVYNFGGSYLRIPAGETLSFEFEIDTTTATPQFSTSLKIKILGDDISTATSEANFLWDEGSGIQATGYLVLGLDLSSHTLLLDTH